MEMLIVIMLTAAGTLIPGLLATRTNPFRPVMSFWRGVLGKTPEAPAIEPVVTDKELPKAPPGFTWIVTEGTSSYDWEHYVKAVLRGNGKAYTGNTLYNKLTSKATLFDKTEFAMKEALREKSEQDALSAQKAELAELVKRANG